jgi:hypothetical protein
MNMKNHRSNPYRFVAALMLVAAGGCGAAQSSGAASSELPAVPPPPPDPPLQLLELIPISAAGAIVVDVGQVRQSRFHGQIMQVVRRFGRTNGWEAQLQLDLAQDVERLLLFGEHTGSQEPVDLARLFREQSFSSVGLVFERVVSAAPGQTQVCHHGDFNRAEVQVIERPNETCQVKRCGRYVSVHCVAPGAPPLVPQATATAPVQQELATLVGAEAAPAAAVVVGPALAGRTSCGGQTVQLAGWQRATVALQSGLELHAQVQTQESDAPQLEQCIRAGLQAAGRFPLLRTFGLADLFQRVEVSRQQGAQQASTVGLRWAVGESELELLLSLLGGAVGGVGQ